MRFKVNYEVRFFQPTKIERDFQIFDCSVIPKGNILKGLIKRYMYPDYNGSSLSIKILNIVNVSGINFQSPIVHITDEYLPPVTPAKPPHWKKTEEVVPEPVAAKNDGGKTGYYDLPTPSAEAIGEILWSVGLVLCPELLEILCNKIKDLCPQTLNDLIEFKKMEPWQHEVFKACYAIDGRAEVKGSPRLRDIRKIKYYAERAETQELKKPAVIETNSENKEVREDTSLNLLAKVHWEWAEAMNWHTGKVDTFGKLVRTVGKLIMNRQEPEKFRLILADIILKTLDIAYDSGVDIEVAIKNQIELNIKLGSEK